MPPPSRDDVRGLVESLAAINAGPDRVRHQTREASQFALLRVIADEPGIRPSAIADHLRIQRSVVTGRLRECRDAGCVKVTPDPEDLRSRRVTLEPAGADLLRRLTEASTDHLSGLVDAWESEDVRRLTDLLEKLRTSIAAASPRQRRSGDARAARGAGEPEWLADFLGH